MGSFAFSDKQDFLTANDLRDILKYDPSTGIFVCISPYGKRRLGAEVGTVRNGRLTINLKSERFFAHRLAWLYMTGEWPIDTIDHIDRNPLNNKWKNLRMATHSEQGMNKGQMREGTLTGTWKYSERDLWGSRIKKDGKYTFLGCFKSAEDAHQAYLEAKAKLHVICTYEKAA